MSLPFRLNLVIALSMFLIIGVGTIFTIYGARRSVHEEVLSSVKLVLRSIDTGFSKAENSSYTIADWQARLTLPDKTRHLKVRLFPLNGKSDPAAERPDPKITLSVPRWFIWWVKPEPLTETRVIEAPEGAFKIVIHDDPNDEIAEAWGEAQGLFGLIILQSLLIWALVHAILGRALKPVPVILRGLEHIEAGDYKERLPDFSLPELSRISAAFNHTASALEKANQENRNLTRRSLTVQEEERKVLSRELHDELGQSLTGIKVITASIARENPTSQGAVDSIIAICDHLFSVVRSMMRRLRPTLLDELGLEASLEDMLAVWREQNPDIRVDLHIEKSIESSATAANIHLFRIVQESLNNVARHAKATTVDIRLEIGDSGRTGAFQKNIRLTITDNGKGYDPESAPPGFGLLGIRERAESLGGRLELAAKPGQGTSIQVYIPIGGLPA